MIANFDEMDAKFDAFNAFWTPIISSAISVACTVYNANEFERKMRTLLKDHVLEGATTVLHLCPF